MAVSLQESEAELRRLLRLACAAFSVDRPPRAVADWWTAEQVDMAAEAAAKEARIASRRELLQQRIDALQAELDSL